jgi:hypothetical protein
MIKNYKNFLFENYNNNYDRIKFIEIYNFSKKITIGLPLKNPYDKNGIIKDVKKSTVEWVDLNIILDNGNLVEYYEYNRDKILIDKELYNYNISKRLYKIINFIRLFKIDIDYIDLGDEPDKITYIKKNRLKTITDKKLDPWNNNYRTSQKIGRFLTDIFGNKITLDDKERFVNYYKAINNFSDNKNIFIVEGEDIRKWYLEDNYSNGYGTLNKSCMRYKENQKVLKLYSKNPDVCKMLIKVDDNNKLLARALLWKTNKGIYMDRIYFVNDYDKNIFELYSKKQGWLSYKKESEKKLKIKLEWWKSKDNSNYPYMDTFVYFNYKEGILYSYDNEDYNIYLDYY